MRIAYRRMSGAIGLSLEEKGTRGLWWEKRRALFSALQNRGHSITLFNRMTKPSIGINSRAAMNFRQDSADVLMIEFGSNNTNFYGEDLLETQEMARLHPGKIVYLCDDPDLPYLWKTVQTDFDRWSVWMNARYAAPFGGQPAEVRCFDFPFSSLQAARVPSHTYQADALVYIGRAGGRDSAVKDLIQSRAPWRVYGRAAEWNKFLIPVFDAPDQPFRANFYHSQIGCLVLADAKHKRLGWRTGRAYHALLAGCPAVVEASHTALGSFQQYREGNELHELLKHWRNPEHRLTEWKRQINCMADERQIVDATLAAHGL